MRIIFSVKWIFSLRVCHVCWYWPSLLRSDPWPHRGIRRSKSTHCLSQRIMLQSAIEQVHQSFLYFIIIFHLKGKQSMCYWRLYMSKMIPNMISLNFAGLLLEMSTIFYDVTRETCHFQHNGGQQYFMNFEWCFWSKTGHFIGNLGPNMIKHVS